jgi:glycosyltransferase involved in cell wall biosynthesis
MNVLSVITTLHKGGAEAHLLLLVQGLLARGVTCEVAFLRSRVKGGSIDLREAFERAGVRTHYLGCEHPFDPRSGPRLNRLLANGKWDLLHSHLPRADGAAMFCKLADRGRVWISTIHHPYDNAYSGARLIPLLAPMWRHADGVIAVSEPVRQWAISRLGVSRHTVRTIVHGVEPKVCGASIPAPVDAPGARCSIGSIGRLEERKGHDTLIRAMVTILKEFPQAQLTIAGHDPWGYGAVLKKLTVELGLENHVHFVGYVEDHDAFFSGIDVFAFASRAEGFGIVVIEAMQAGKCPVVSDIPPLNGIIAPGESGLVGRLDDPLSFAGSILSLFRDRAYLSRMGEQARRRVETEFSQDRMVERALDFYGHVLTHARRAR